MIPNTLQLKLPALLGMCVFCMLGAVRVSGQESPKRVATGATSNAGCFRGTEGAEVPEPEDLRSVDGVLKVDLAFRGYVDSGGNARYCYVTADGAVSPTLRVKPGDTLILNLKNEARATDSASRGTAGASQNHGAMKMDVNGDEGNEASGNARDACSGGAMVVSATNLHFHGLAIPAACHADETLKTLVEPSDPAFEYRFQIPESQPPGLYWYHPHVHGMSRFQILGGASGALIVEGIERVNRQLAGLHERVFVIRDESLVHPEAEPPGLSMATQVRMRDPEGDMLNTGTGEGKPAKDLSINYVPVPYPKYPPAVIRMKPSQKELWRVVNASAITYLNLQVLFNSVPQPLGVVGLDGAPLAEGGEPARAMLKVSHLVVPPGGRVEFVVNGPGDGVAGSLVTRGVDTGPLGENDPLRALATIAVSPDAPEPRAALAANPAPLAAAKEGWLGDVAPVRERKLYFSEKQENPNDPNSPTTFFVTVEGQTPKAFDPNSALPNMVAQQGTVEDWTIENRTQEFHAFHIHLIHFLMIEWNGRKVDEPFLRDTVNLEYWDGKSATYPSIKLRMDFRDPNAVGILPYHCHLLEHQDGGMMGILRVEPAASQGVAAK
ncbi:MAG: multicopper oxidase domain-containing protein [Candidatus Acidiferrum sp.]